MEQYSYDVFGEPTIRDANDQLLTTSDYGNPYMFTGRRYDSETGLYYYRFRYYRPEIGRFLQTDPIDYLGGLNLYTYVGNNPLNWIDPWGLSRYWRWDDWWDYALVLVHGPFEVGNWIGDRLVGIPKAHARAKNMLNTRKVRESRDRMFEEAVKKYGNMPKTLGPLREYSDWAADTVHTIKDIPGTTLTGPVPTNPAGVINDALTIMIGDQALEAVEDKETCRRN